jgi:hypothetical protein
VHGPALVYGGLDVVIGVTRDHRLALFVDCHDCMADSGLMSVGRVFALFHTHGCDVAIIRWRSPMEVPSLVWA